VPCTLSLVRLLFNHKYARAHSRQQLQNDDVQFTKADDNSNELSAEDAAFFGIVRATPQPVEPEYDSADDDYDLDNDGYLGIGDAGVGKGARVTAASVMKTVSGVTGSNRQKPSTKHSGLGGGAVGDGMSAKFNRQINLGAMSSRVANSVREVDKKLAKERFLVKDKADRATSEQVLDPRTRMILLKMLNRGMLLQCNRNALRLMTPSFRAALALCISVHRNTRFSSTLCLQNYFISSDLFKRVNGCVSTGKEANVYHASSEEGDRAIKIYKTSILVFKDRDRYVSGEHRFRHGVGSASALVTFICVVCTQRTQSCAANAILTINIMYATPIFYSTASRTRARW
jgi:RIO kinase 1